MKDGENYTKGEDMMTIRLSKEYDKYSAIEAWSDGVYFEYEREYAIEIIKEHGITKKVLEDYKKLHSSQAYNNCPFEQSLLETLELELSDYEE